MNSAASPPQMRSCPYMEIFGSQARCRGGDLGVGTELPNLSLSSAQALSVPVQQQDDVLLTVTTFLAFLKHISAGGGNGAGGKSQGYGSEDEHMAFPGCRNLGRTPRRIFIRQNREGPRKKGMQKRPGISYCAFVSFLLSLRQDWHQRGRMVPLPHC